MKRVVLLHGFTQGPGSWDWIVSYWGDRYEVVRPTLPGHGEGAGPVTGSFEAEAARLADAVGGPPAIWVGYSMGGRMALRVALDRPDLVRALVLLGATPGLPDEADRADRMKVDEQLASGLERKGLEAFLAGWLRQSLFTRLPKGAAGMEERKLNTAEGLASVLRRLGTGVQEPLWDRLGALLLPTLLMAGEHDTKFVAVAFHMAAALGDVGQLSIVPGAGHAAHLERPEMFAGLVGRFIDQVP